VVKILGIGFALLLAAAHYAEVDPEAYSRPLSMFRDYSPAWVGYVLFALLVAIGLETGRTALRVQYYVLAALYVIGTLLLVIVAATPSFSSLHNDCALLVMVTLFCNFAIRLWLADQVLLFVVHLCVPTLLMIATRIESYGIWQKGMILYFVGAVVIDHTVLSQWLRGTAKSPVTDTTPTPGEDLRA